MPKTLLVGLTAAFLALNILPAAAGVSDEILLGRLSGTNELAQSGAALVSFVQGSPLVTNKVEHVAPASIDLRDVEADRYYGGSVMLTLATLIVVAIAFAFAAIANRAPRDRAERRAPGRDSWRDEVMRMLESDLTNLDGLNPRGSR